MRGLGLTALIVCTIAASAASAGVPFVYKYSGKFTAIGDGPSVQWETGFNGVLSPVTAPGVANVLVNFEDNQGVSITNLPMTMVAHGYFVTGSGLNEPFLAINFGLYLVAPLTVDGVTYGAGTGLVGGGCPLYLSSFLGEGGCEIDDQTGTLFSKTPTYHSSFGYSFSQAPEEQYVTNGSGTYPFTIAGAAQMSGAFAGGGTPEPATWALMLAGFGIAGAALRRRRFRSI